VTFRQSGPHDSLQSQVESPTIECHKMPDTEFGVCKLLADISTQAREVVVYMEQPPLFTGNKIPGSSVGKMMWNAGILYGACVAMGMEVHRVTPPAWQQAHPVGTKSGMTTTKWKNKLKARAGELFPPSSGVTVTLWNADALLILDAARRGAIA